MSDPRACGVACVAVGVTHALPYQPLARGIPVNSQPAYGCEACEPGYWLDTLNQDLTNIRKYEIEYSAETMGDCRGAERGVPPRLIGRATTHLLRVVGDIL